MEGLIKDYKAKNFKLNIEGSLYAINGGLDFDGFLDTRQALGAEMFIDIIKKLDEEGLDDWTIFGWFGDQDFGEDFNGQMEDGTSFFNESYFTNEAKMDALWMNMPCLKLKTGYHNSDNPPKVYLSISLAPYEREDIMDMIDFTNVVIDNEEGFMFPGSGATIKVRDEEHRRRISDECSIPLVLTFKMPQTFCVKIRHADGTVKDSWVFILPQDVDDMRERLHEMIMKERDL